MAASAGYTYQHFEKEAVKARLQLSKAQTALLAEKKQFAELQQVLVGGGKLPSLQVSFLAARRIFEETASSSRVTVHAFAFGDSKRALSSSTPVLGGAKAIRSVEGVKYLPLTVKGSYEDLALLQSWVSQLTSQLPLSIREVELEKSEFTLGLAVFGTVE